MRFELTIPKNTAINTPLVIEAQIMFSRLDRVVVLIPSGHAYLTGLKILSGFPSMIVPAQGSGVNWLRGDNDRIEVNPGMVFDGPPWKCVMSGYNLDDTYQHTFFIDIEGQ